MELFVDIVAAPSGPARGTAALFLDRDGTLIRDERYLGDPARVTLLPGVPAALRRLSRAGWRLVVISNQSGIGRGLLTPDQVRAVDQRLWSLLQVEGVLLEAFYRCPHAPGAGCACRKPATGLVTRATADLGLDLASCAVIGDSEADLALGRALGIPAYGVDTGLSPLAGPSVLGDLTAVAERLGAPAPGPDELLRDLAVRHPRLGPAVPSVRQAYDLLRRAFGTGGRLLLCGHGGSAADCDHWSGELLKGVHPRGTPPRTPGLPPVLAASLREGLPAISLPGMVAATTAFANDADPTWAFAQGTWVLGRPGDALAALTTSGRSPAVLHALLAAQVRGMSTLALTGERGLAEGASADVVVAVPGREPWEVQELHLPVIHCLSRMLEAGRVGRNEGQGAPPPVMAR